MIIMMIFNMWTSYFSQKFVSLFWGLFNDETDLRVSKVCSPRGPIRVYDFFDWPTTVIGLGGDI